MPKGKKINRRYKKCSEHTNPKSVTEKWSTASEKEWRPLTEEKFSKEEEQREEHVSHIDQYGTKTKDADPKREPSFQKGVFKREEPCL